MWVSITLYTMKLHCVSTNTNTEHSALCVTKNAYVCHVATAGLHWTSHSTVLFFKFNPCNRWLHYRGFTLAPCDVSRAMLSLNHRIVRLMIDMLLHSYMHRWKNNLLRLRVRVQLVLGGLACINTIALQSVKDRLTAWTHEVVTNKRSESVHLTWYTCNLASSIIFLQASLAIQRIWQR